MTFLVRICLYCGRVADEDGRPYRYPTEDERGYTSAPYTCSECYHVPQTCTLCNKLPCECPAES
jgi:hypothetical protein